MRFVEEGNQGDLDEVVKTDLKALLYMSEMIKETI